MIFVVNDGEVIGISNGEGGDVGGEEGSNADGDVGGNDEIDIEEWWSVFPEDDDDDTSLDPAPIDGGLNQKDWLDLHFGRK